MSDKKRLKDADDFHDLYMKRKDRLEAYKNNVLGEKAKKALGFPSIIYGNWQAHWTLDDELIGIPDIRFHPKEEKTEVEEVADEVPE